MLIKTLKITPTAAITPKAITTRRVHILSPNFRFSFPSYKFTCLGALYYANRHRIGRYHEIIIMRSALFIIYSFHCVLSINLYCLRLCALTDKHVFASKRENCVMLPFVLLHCVKLILKKMLYCTVFSII